MYETCLASISASHNNNIQNLEESRWTKILGEKDSKKIWNAINWKGNFDIPHQSDMKPDDSEFAKYFSNLLNPTTSITHLQIPNVVIYIPVLDDPISPGEVIEQIKRLKPNKACGVDGIPPGILKLLDDDWILLITYLYNLIFEGQYPDIWSISRMFVAFKKGLIEDPSNYRGISIMIALCKVYDGILNQRFMKWYIPEYEQAGGQSGRGCIEQILTLRLLIDSAKTRKRVLYVVFIDYVKAFDKVDRTKLLNMLANKGCGSKFLDALGRTLQDTKSRIGKAEFISSKGVRQGGVTSTSLFTFYIDTTIQALRQVGPDDFLGNLHSILLMDDTVVLATSRSMMNKKLEILAKTAENIGMLIHPNKSKFMVCNKIDKEPFVLGNVTVAHTDSYVYLGTPITVGSISSQIALHIKNKEAHLRKFTSFLTKNKDAPFKVKKLVLTAALNSALLYGAETWYSDNLQPLIQPILSATKQLMGVREQTCNDIIYVESGTVSPKSIIRDRQKSFLKKIKARQDFELLPISKAMELSKNWRSPMGLYLVHLELDQTNDIKEFQENNFNRIRLADTTRRRTYLEINPNLTVHPLYNSDIVPEHYRISFTRLRLSSHYLKIETGRWSRIPREERVCQCGEVQTEIHVLLVCPLLQYLRISFEELDFSSLENLMNNENHYYLAKYIHTVLIKCNS